MGMIGEWAKEWNTTKKAFETKTGKKKPSTKILGTFRKSTKIEGSCKKLDKIYITIGPACSDARKNPAKKLKTALKIINSFAKEVKSLDKSVKDYIKVVEKEIKADKDAESSYVKQLAVLKADLKAIVATAVAQINFNKDYAKKLSSTQLTLNNLHISLAGGVKKAKLFAAKVKADPTPAKFNDGIYKAARDMSQQLTNAVKYQKKGQIVLKKSPANISKVLEAWSNKGRKVPTDADKKGVIRELGAFVQIISAISKWSKNEVG